MSAHENPVRLPLMGLTFVVILLAALVLAVCDYRGVFVSRRDVTMYADQGGNQLTVGAQVKLHGAVVGTVDKMQVSGTEAKLTLGLDPDFVHMIPANVEARILPKTLIGQDYIDLVVPQGASARTIAAGDVISRDHSATAVELETALNNLLVTLNRVPPQKLSVALNSVATALNGRGEEVGHTMVTLERYLAGLNPSMPKLVADLRAIVKTAHTYDRAAPELLSAARSLTTTAKTLVQQRDDLATLYRDTTNAANTTTAFLQANGDNIIDVVAASRRTLGILARYAPEYPCLLSSLNGLVPRLNAAFGAGTDRPALHVTLQVGLNRGKYVPGTDDPAYLDHRGPRCYPVMKTAPQYPADGPIKDGSSSPPGAGGVGLTDGDADTDASPSLATTPNSPAESDLLGALFGDGTTKAPDFSSLLLGPLLRGSQVSVR